MVVVVEKYNRRDIRDIERGYMEDMDELHIRDMERYHIRNRDIDIDIDKDKDNSDQNSGVCKKMFGLCSDKDIESVFEYMDS